MTRKLPGERGYRLPAEFEEHASTWMAWPYDERTWVAGVEAAENAFLAMIEALSPEPVNLIVRPVDADRVRELIRERGLANASLHETDYADAWIRDTGPMTLVDEDGDRVAVDARFDAWGGKYEELKRDDRLAGFVADVEGLERVRLDWVLEGGAIDTDGRGRLLTTESCLVEHRDNPVRSELEERLEATLGVDEMLWLDGQIAGDDTEGHVDAFARFADEETVLAAVEPDAGDENHAVLADNRKRLERAAAASSRSLDVVELPMPEPIVFEDQRLPATYANFYVGNEAVLVPVFDDPADADALEILKEAFDDRRVKAIDARNLVVGFGACHCLTMQMPASRPRDT